MSLRCLITGTGRCGTKSTACWLGASWEPDLGAVGEATSRMLNGDDDGADMDAILRKQAQSHEVIVSWIHLLLIDRLPAGVSAGSLVRDVRCFIGSGMMQDAGWWSDDGGPIIPRDKIIAYLGSTEDWRSKTEIERGALYWATVNRYLLDRCGENVFAIERLAASEDERRRLARLAGVEKDCALPFAHENIGRYALRVPGWRIEDEMPAIVRLAGDVMEEIYGTDWASS